jgi:CheY-like chemotaxis protein/anti-sigma regulatory factor (Ser/Thr protein kinase)
MPPGSQFFILTDEKRLLKLLSILLHNAVKFTPNGKITLALTPKDGSYCISVSDAGIGIAAEKQRHIFELFGQGELNSATRRYSGTGIGLYLAAQLARVLNASIKLQSEVDEGCTFEVWLRSRNITEIAESDETKLKDDILKEKHFLIVEDTLANALFLEELIEELGSGFTTVATGRAAIEFFKSDKKADIVLLDIQLPDINGFEVFDQISKLTTVPIIAQTAYAFSRDKRLALERGFADYLAKPIDPDEFERIVMAHLA